MEGFIAAAVCMLITFVTGSLFGMLLLTVAKFMARAEEQEEKKKPSHAAGRKAAKDDE